MRTGPPSSRAMSDTRSAALASPVAHGAERDARDLLGPEGY